MRCWECWVFVVSLIGDCSRYLRIVDSSDINLSVSLCRFFRARTHVIVKGLGQIGSGSRDQSLLTTRLTAVLSNVGSELEFNIVKVNVFPPPNHPVYDVELETAESVDALLKAFSRFTRRYEPITRPSSLDGLSMYHSVTTGTRVRISLLRVSYILISKSFKYLYLMSPS